MFMFQKVRSLVIERFTGSSNILTMRLAILTFIVLTSFTSTVKSFAQDYQLIESRLTSIYTLNLQLRSKVMPTIQKYGVESPQMDTLNAQILEFDSLALAYVTNVLENHGWLGKSTIGEAGNQALFVTIQHASSELRKKYFPMLAQSAALNESDPSSMATMLDRMLVDEGKPQIYGTQSRMVDGELKLYPIEDPKNVNKKRKKVGLKKLKI